MRPFARTIARVLVGIAAPSGLLGIAALACVIADPPTELPRVPDRRPTIVHASVFPPSGSIISAWPDKFVIPVELSNPASPIGYAAFVDYNSATGAGLDSRNNLQPSPTNSGSVRILEIAITRPPLDGCHRVEVVVALSVNLQGDPHALSSPGGDIVHWIYNPAGDLAGCPVLDAGFEPLADAEAGVP